MLRSAVVGLLIVLVAIGLLWGLQRRLIYLPDGRVPQVTALGAGSSTAREVSYRSADGVELRGWLLPPTGPDLGTHVLVFPGNAGNRADRADLGRRLAAAGLSVLLVDYRGYGGNPGSPSEAGLLADARAAREYLVQRAGARPDHLVYLGESLGAAVATALAVEHPPAGLVLRSPFTALADVGQRLYPVLPVRLLLWDRFPVREQISGVTVPTVVVYGAEDELVPAAQSRAVADAAPGLVRAVAVPGARHNDPDLADAPALVTAVTDLAPGAG
ncbi:MAG: alpha/beta hydrolase [Pseudonocardia sp.]